MNIEKNLIFLKNIDKTGSVESLRYDGAMCFVQFNSSLKEYTYLASDIVWYKNGREIDIKDYIVYIDGIAKITIKKIIDFKDYYRVIGDKNNRLYRKNRVKIVKDSFKDRRVKNLFSYFRSVADIIGMKPHSKNTLTSQYDNISKIPEDTVLSNYFLPDNVVFQNETLDDNLIFPFGTNISQKTALEKALSSKISIIEGPPGTGKTQTILNIIANLIVEGKSLAVVSNNNMAIENVEDKLRKYNFDFLVAFLGKCDNIESFIKNQKGYPYDISRGRILDDEKEEINENLRMLESEINEKLIKKNALAKVKSEITEIKTEYGHFKKTYKIEADEELENAVRIFSSDKLLSLIAEIEGNVVNRLSYGIIKKIYMIFKYNFRLVRLLGKTPEKYILRLQRLFYIKKEDELLNQRESLEKDIENFHFEEKLEELRSISIMLFKDYIARRFGNKERIKFKEDDLHKKSSKFIDEYPIILSTAYSLKNVLSKDFIYDYIIVDEASQLDIATAIPFMSCAKNIVIVGDLKQLPNIVSKEYEQKTDALWNPNIPCEYRYTRQSFLSSAHLVWKDAPKTLLREHYRCKPSIIGFCNRKFYANKLIVMTEEDEKDKPLILYKTVPGNHERNKKNMRELDVIKEEILPYISPLDYKNIGIITPFKNQVRALECEIPSDIEVDTVHKFQGREKDIIILSSVSDDTSNAFVNDPNLLNVAVSRAVKKLIVVTSGNPKNENTNYGDLAKYISYNNFEIIESHVNSVFDLLYKQYFTERMKYLKKHKRISEYDSENLMYSIIENILSEDEFISYGCVAHVPLVQIVKDMSILSKEERIYAGNILTHVDFLIYNRMDKSPVLAIEVDGVSFHKEGSRQAERDKLKNHIFKIIHIDLIRFRTDGSCEEEKIRENLRAIKGRKEAL